MILRLLRRSLLLQSVTILLVTLAALVLSMQVMLQSSLVFRVFPSLLDRQAETVLALATLIEHSDAEARRHMLTVFSTDGRAAELADAFPVDAVAIDFLDERFRHAAERTGEPIGAGRLRFRLAAPEYNLRTDRQRGEGWSGMPVVSLFETSIRLATGDVLVVKLTPLAILGRYALAFLLLALLASAGISIACLQVAFRPLRELERAAGAIGHTSRLLPVAENGPEDIQRVARALNAMQSRVQTLLAERSHMVAAVAHDIRTSLTHMKLRMDAIDVLRGNPLHGDIDQMERLVGDMMLYANAERPSSSLELVELAEFVPEVCSRLPGAIDLEVCNEAFLVAADRFALTRALTNLIENARLYANDTQVSVSVENGDCLVRVDDRGPGVPDEQLSFISEPFFRGEYSRNRATGGAGLGLSIARGLLGAQGATLTITNRAVVDCVPKCVSAPTRELNEARRQEAMTGSISISRTPCSWS